MDLGVNLTKEVFSDAMNFEETALKVFRFQYQQNTVYQQYVDALKVEVASIKNLRSIPFLPIRFFKTHKVLSTDFEAELVFESSGTTATVNSKHYIKSTAIYEHSFKAGFAQFYGDIKNWCILGLLPSYLERKNSSLVYMVQSLVEESKHPQSGFYLYDFNKLSDTLKQLEQNRQPTLLIGVTFALLDFAEKYKQPLHHTIIMETGGMKGRRRDLIRNEVQDILKTSFEQVAIHSEYGMTELLSQAYSKSEGIFYTPDWMRIVLREEDDPLTIKHNTDHKTRGLINIIDLANIYSCSFIATDDLGALYPDGSFEITGRLDNSDLRGCSLLSL
ncbi:MAG TPA: acyl transferase [Niabella sp.]|nr:acyl transferase [Niabella sp.]HQW14884.1 acyl transferase [Niabella sp.]HQX18491.1 acyl transferase [Niabella sp.]HQX41489.1 acyl transferase [Niabella sp.]HRB06018.1 acyl transferase [Niabella sp.]